MLPRSSQRYETHRDSDPFLRRTRRLLGFLVLVFLLYEGITTLVLASVEQETVAMRPTLEPGDRMFTLPPVFGPRLRLVGWTLPGLRSPERGDLVTVRPGFTREPGFAARLIDPFYRFFTLQNRRIEDRTEWDSSLQIKRIVALPGDTIRFERFVAYIRPAGEAQFTSEFAISRVEYELLAEERPEGWQPLDPFGAAAPELTLGDDEYYVLSDNRSSGTDSRHWGPVASDALIARVTVRFWPPSRLGRP